MSNSIIDSVAKSMDKAIQALKSELTKLRTGRSSIGLLDAVQVDYYGSHVPLSQVANLTTPDARTIQVSPWEAGMVAAIEKAILSANLGLNPQNDGKIIRVPLPAMTEERRRELVKLVKKMGEEAKIAIRNHRREGNEDLKKAEKAKSISEDEVKKCMEQVQKKTDEKVAEVEKVLLAKEKDIMTI